MIRVENGSGIASSSKPSDSTAGAAAPAMAITAKSRTTQRISPHPLAYTRAPHIYPFPDSTIDFRASAVAARPEHQRGRHGPLNEHAEQDARERWAPARAEVARVEQHLVRRRVHGHDGAIAAEDRRKPARPRRAVRLPKGQPRLGKHVHGLAGCAVGHGAAERPRPDERGVPASSSPSRYCNRAARRSASPSCEYARRAGSSRHELELRAQDRVLGRGAVLRCRRRRCSAQACPQRWRPCSRPGPGRRGHDVVVEVEAAFLVHDGGAADVGLERAVVCGGRRAAARASAPEQPRAVVVRVELERHARVRAHGALDVGASAPLGHECELVGWRGADCEARGRVLLVHALGEPDARAVNGSEGATVQSTTRVRRGHPRNHTRHNHAQQGCWST